MTWIITGLAIIGVILNIQKSSWCFVLWIITNTSWMIVDFYHGLYSQSFLFLVYLCLSIWGLIKWRMSENEE